MEPAPIRSVSAPAGIQLSPLARLRREFFATPGDGLITLALLAGLGAAVQALLHWALRQADWAVIRANSTLLAVGRYPLGQQWRLWLLTALLLVACGGAWGLLRGRGWPRNDRLAAALVVLLALVLPWSLKLNGAVQARWWGLAALLLLGRWAAGRWGTRLPDRWQRLQALVWPLLYVVGLALIGGGLGLQPVTPSQWGGLLLTLLAASFAISLCFPLGIALALGRRSALPLLRWSATLYIEFIRGAPLITLLFLGQNILGFMLPGGLAPERLWRAIWILTFFAAAYVAEAVRAGLAALPRGQEEAARSLGLNGLQTLSRIVLPQALRVALPALVGQFITLLQDTTLLSLIGLLDLLGVARAIMTNPDFLGRNAEVYLVLAVLFWCCCAALGLGSRALERRLGRHALPS